MDKNYEFIDALRGWAILGVVISHTLSNVNIVSVAQHGVQLFFLVSVYTVFMSLHNRQVKTGLLDLRTYAIRRCFRILPIFYIAILFNLSFPLEYMKFFQPDGVNSFVLFSTIFMFFGWHPSSINAVVPGSWSLSSEFFFYLLIPISFLLIKRAKISNIALSKLLTVLSVVTSLIAVLISKHYRSDSSVFVGYDPTLLWYYYQLWFPMQACLLFSGIALFYWRLDRQTAFKHETTISFVLFFLFSYLIIDADSLDGLAYACLACAALFNLAAIRQELFLFKSKMIIGLGKISFSVYVSHFFIINHLEAFLSRDEFFGVPFLLISLLMSSLISVVTYNLIEKKFIKFGHKLSTKL